MTTVRPFGSVLISYCSFGGRVAAPSGTTGTTAAAARSAAQRAGAPPITRRACRAVIRSRLRPISFAGNADSGDRPRDRDEVDRRRVVPMLRAKEDFEVGFLSGDARAELEPRRLLHAVSPPHDRVDAEHLPRRASEPLEVRIHLVPHRDIPVHGPGVVDLRVLREVAGARAYGQAGVVREDELPEVSTFEGVVRNRVVLRPVAQVSRLVM